MSYQILKMESAERWKVLFRDDEKWLIGLYIPEFESTNEIDRLEKHDAPEFFHLFRGKYRPHSRRGQGNCGGYHEYVAQCIQT